MTEKEIIEGNKLIAEFMGGRWIGTDWIGDKRFDQCFIDSDGDTCVAKYHSSWDWLMPVVNKVTNIIENNSNGLDVDIFESMRDWILSVNIENAYTDLVELIKWYNTQNSTTND